VGYLTKPFSDEALVDALLKTLSPPVEATASRPAASNAMPPGIG
jgi:hypothetical protein